jgi:TrpR-related protein YerC/YecD
MQNEKIKSKYLDKLFDAILQLENLDDCYAFFTDLCSIAEIKSFEQRYQVAELLYCDVTYNAISQITNASTATISRINRSLHYGEGGYMKAIKRQVEEEQNQQNK